MKATPRPYIQSKAHHAHPREHERRRHSLLVLLELLVLELPVLLVVLLVLLLELLLVLLHSQKVLARERLAPRRQRAHRRRGQRLRLAHVAEVVRRQVVHRGGA